MEKKFDFFGWFTRTELGKKGPNCLIEEIQNITKSFYLLIPSLSTNVSNI